MLTQFALFTRLFLNMRNYDPACRPIRRYEEGGSTRTRDWPLPPSTPDSCGLRGWTAGADIPKIGTSPASPILSLGAPL